MNRPYIPPPHIIKYTHLFVSELIRCVGWWFHTFPCDWRYLSTCPLARLLSGLIRGRPPPSVLILLNLQCDYLARPQPRHIASSSRFICVFSFYIWGTSVDGWDHPVARVWIPSEKPNNGFTCNQVTTPWGPCVPLPSRDVDKWVIVGGGRVVRTRLLEQVTSVTLHSSDGCRTHAPSWKATGTISASLNSWLHTQPQTHTPRTYFIWLDPLYERLSGASMIEMRKK